MIPKIIHQIWIGDQSRRPTRLMETWGRAHPDWEYRVWDDQAIADLGLINLTAYETVPEWAGKADVARYEILHRYGGWFIDADSLCLRPLPGHLLGHTLVAAYEKAGGDLIANGYIGVAPRSWYTFELIRRIKSMPRAYLRSKSAWQVVGPTLFTAAVEDARRVDSGLHIIPPGLFMPEHHTSQNLQKTLDVSIDSLRERYPDAVSYQFWGSTFNLY